MKGKELAGLKFPTLNVVWEGESLGDCGPALAGSPEAPKHTMLMLNATVEVSCA